MDDESSCSIPREFFLRIFFKTEMDLRTTINEEDFFSFFARYEKAPASVSINASGEKSGDPRWRAFSFRKLNLTKKQRKQNGKGRNWMKMWFNFKELLKNKKPESSSHWSFLAMIENLRHFLVNSKHYSPKTPLSLAEILSFPQLSLKFSRREPNVDIV